MMPKPVNTTGPPAENLRSRVPPPGVISTKATEVAPSYPADINTVPEAEPTQPTDTSSRGVPAQTTDNPGSVVVPAQPTATNTASETDPAQPIESSSRVDPVQPAKDTHNQGNIKVFQVQIQTSHPIWQVLGLSLTSNFFRFDY